MMISNQGPNQLPVQVRLFNRSGVQFDLPALTLGAHEVRSLDLRQSAPQGAEFEDGNVAVEFRYPSRHDIDGRIGARQNINLQDIANSRATVGMFGSGFIEMLARQMTRELQAIRDTIASGGSASLVAKSISLGVLSRRADGAWNISGVEGIPAVSLVSRGLRQYCPWPAGLVLFRVSGVRHSDGGDAQTGRLANLREHRLPFCGLARRREFFDGVSKRTDSRKLRKWVEAC